MLVVQEVIVVILITSPLELLDEPIQERMAFLVTGVTEGSSCGSRRGMERAVWTSQPE